MTAMITPEATYATDAFNANIAADIFLSEEEAVEHFVKMLAAEAYAADKFDTLAEAEADDEVREVAEDLAAKYAKESKVLEQYGDVDDYRNTSATDCNCADVEVRLDGYYAVSYGRYEGLESPGQDVGPFATIEEARAQAVEMVELANRQECGYCNHEVEVATVPEVDDEEAWATVAAQHGEGCEWVLTRAHRI